MADKQVNIAKLCDMHRYALVQQTAFSRKDPWMALELVTQAALFQATTVDEEIWKHIGGDVEKIGELGCLACLKPAIFREIVANVQHNHKNKAIQVVKELGESYIKKVKPS